MDAFNIFRKLTYGTGINYKMFDVRMNFAEQEKQKKASAGSEKQCHVSDNLDIPSEKNDEPSNKRKQSVSEEEGDISVFADNVKEHVKKKKKKMTRAKLATIKEEEVKHFRRKHQIQVWGSDIPHPVEEFSKLQTACQFHPAVLDNLSKLGYSSPTPVQMQVIPVMLHERQILACAPTGSGKTASFFIPIIQKLKTPKKKWPRAVVIAPTRELAKQLYNEGVRLSEGTSLRLCILNKKFKMNKNETGKKKPKRFDILISTPNRLIYAIQQDQATISLANVEWLIIDESDKLFECGKQGFRDQLAVIYKACDSSNVKRAMFSATFSYDVEEWCKLNLDGLITVSVGDRNTAIDTVKQEVIFTGDDSGKIFHFRDLIRQGFNPPVLVFVESKENAKKLYSELMYDDINVDAIHADRTQQEREKVIRDFRLGKVWVLICTDLMCRGIDFKGVNLVVNYDLPPDAITYIHRIGRTGRAGRSGHAITYFNESDFPKLKNVLRGRLQKLLAPFETGTLDLPSAS